MNTEEAMRHAGDMLSSPYQFERRAMEAMPKYLFTVGNRKHREGYCTLCQRWMELGPHTGWYPEPEEWEDAAIDRPEAFWPDDFRPEDFRLRYDRLHQTRHGTFGYCPECGSRVMFRGWNISRKTLRDSRLLVEYRKSEIDPQAVVCVAYDCRAHWDELSEEQKDVLYMLPREFCVFRWGKGGERYKYEPRYQTGPELAARPAEEWRHTRQCVSGWAPGFCGNQIGTVLDRESFEDAVSGTLWGKLLEEYPALLRTDAAGYYDRITLMDRVARYGCVEYLLKLGQDNLAMAVTDRSHTERMNLRGKTPQKVLRLTDAQWAEVKGKKMKLTIDDLYGIGWAKEHRLKLNMEVIHWLTGPGGLNEYTAHHVEETAKRFGAVMELQSVIRYCRKRKVRLGDYCDYAHQLNQLGCDMTDRQLLWPRHFEEMHGRMNIRQRFLANREQNDRIAERVSAGKLDGYFFAALGWVMRPMLTAEEIIDEGNIQHICVGGYVGKYAEGGDVLCVLRDEQEPRKPLYTVEFSNEGRLIQCRGYKNDYGEEGQKRKKHDQSRLDLFFRLHSMARTALESQRRTKDKKERAAV